MVWWRKIWLRRWNHRWNKDRPCEPRHISLLGSLLKNRRILIRIKYGSCEIVTPPFHLRLSLMNLLFKTLNKMEKTSVPVTNYWFKKKIFYFRWTPRPSSNLPFTNNNGQNEFQQLTSSISTSLSNSRTILIWIW